MVMFITGTISVYLEHLKPWQEVGFKGAPITRMPSRSLHSLIHDGRLPVDGHTSCRSIRPTGKEVRHSGPRCTVGLGRMTGKRGFSPSVLGFGYECGREDACDG